MWGKLGTRGMGVGDDVDVGEGEVVGVLDGRGVNVGGTGLGLGVIGVWVGGGCVGDARRLERDGVGERTVVVLAHPTHRITNPNRSQPGFTNLHPNRVYHARAQRPPV